MHPSVLSIQAGQATYKEPCPGLPLLGILLPSSLSIHQSRTNQSVSGTELLFAPRPINYQLLS